MLTAGGETLMMAVMTVIYRMANPEEREGFGIVVTYMVKVRLFLGALAGELVGELPIILMHPKVSHRHSYSDLVQLVCCPNSR